MPTDPEPGMSFPYEYEFRARTLNLPAETCFVVDRAVFGGDTVLFYIVGEMMVKTAQFRSNIGNPVVTYFGSSLPFETHIALFVILFCSINENLKYGIMGFTRTKKREILKKKSQRIGKGAARYAPVEVW